MGKLGFWQRYRWGNWDSDRGIGGEIGILTVVYVGMVEMLTVALI